jgi:hypothetical protein
MNPKIRFSIYNPRSQNRNENIHPLQKALSVVTGQLCSKTCKRRMSSPPRILVSRGLLKISI